MLFRSLGLEVLDGMELVKRQTLEILMSSVASPRSRGVGALRVAGTLATSLRGLWVSGILSPGQWWNERIGGDPKTDQVTQGADS